MGKAGKIIIAVIIVILVSTGIAFGVIYHKITQDNIKDKYTLTDPDDGITLTAIKGTLFGKEFDISEKQLNTYFNKKFCTQSDGSNSGVDHIMVYFHEDEPCEVYAHAFHKGFGFAIRCKADFTVDEDDNIVKLSLTDAVVGELELSQSTLNNVLEKILHDNKKVRYIDEYGSNVEFTANYTIEIPNTSGINLGIEEASAKDSALTVKTNSLTGEALKAGMEYVTSKEGKEAISGLIENVKNNIKDKISDWLSR